MSARSSKRRLKDGCRIELLNLFRRESLFGRKSRYPITLVKKIGIVVVALMALCLGIVIVGSSVIATITFTKKIGIALGLTAAILAFLLAVTLCIGAGRLVSASISRALREAERDNAIARNYKLRDK